MQLVIAMTLFCDSAPTSGKVFSDQVNYFEESRQWG